MTAEDMKDLIDIYDAANELGNTISTVFAASLSGVYDDSIYGRLIKVEEIIKRNCVTEMGFETETDYPVGIMILHNDEYSSEEKAKILLGQEKVFSK